MSNKQVTYIIAAVAFTMMTLLVALNSYTYVGVGKEKVGATFGKVHDAPLEAGLHIVNPLADFETYDLQEMTYSWDDVGVPAQDNLNTVMDVAVTGRFVTGMTASVREHHGSAAGFMANQVKRRVPAMIIEVGKELAEDSQAFYGKDTLAVMESTIISRLNEELAPRGYEITAVKFSDIRLPEVVTRAVIKTKERQQQVNEQAATLEIADLRAQEKTAEAKANAESAEFNAAATRAAADAELYRAQQEALGNRALAASVTPALIALKEAEAKLKWDGKLPGTMLGEGINYFMGAK